MDALKTEWGTWTIKDVPHVSARRSYISHDVYCQIHVFNSSCHRIRIVCYIKIQGYQGSDIWCI